MIADRTGFLQVVRDGICHIDFQHRFTFINPAWAQRFGRQPVELIGRRMIDIAPHVEGSPIDVATREALHERRERHLEAYSVAFGRWFELSCYPDANGLLMHFHDVHDRKIAQLRAERLHAVTDALTAASSVSEVLEVLLEAALPAVEAEAGAVGLLRGDPPELHLAAHSGLEAKFVQLWQPAPMTFASPQFDVIQSGETLVYSAEQLRERYPHLADRARENPGTRACLPLKVGARTLGVWQLWFPDHSEPDEASLQFAETLTGLCAVALARALEYDELERAVEQRTARLLHLNHELHAYADAVAGDLTPAMRRVQGFADQLSRRLRPHIGPQEAQYFEHLLGEAQRAMELVQNLGTFAAATAQLNVTDVSLGQLVSQARAELITLLRHRSVAWTTHDLPIVRADAALLEQVLIALLANALRFTRTRTTAVIEVGAEQDEHGTTVWVQDNGVGFDPEVTGDVFHRQAPAADGHVRGLGLAMVRRVVERHGGRAWAESCAGDGATFYFTLPHEPPTCTPAPTACDAHPK